MSPRKKVDRKTALFRELKQARMKLTGRSFITVGEHVQLWEQVDRYLAEHPSRGKQPRAPHPEEDAP